MKNKQFFAVVSIIVFLAYSGYAQINEDRLNDAIIAVLKKSYPKDKVTKYSGFISAKASVGSTGLVSLRENLVGVFSDNSIPQLTWLDWPNHSALLTKYASDIAYLEYPDLPPAVKLKATADHANEVAAVAADKARDMAEKASAAEQAVAPPPAQAAPASSFEAPATVTQSNDAMTRALLAQADALKANADATKANTELFATQTAQSVQVGLPGDYGGTNDIYGQFNVWTGAKFSNPYTINGNKLQAAGSSSDGYIEFGYSGRYILRQGDKASDVTWPNWGTKTEGDDDMHFVNPLAHLPDIESKIGYIFRSSSAPTNYNASTIVGSADFYSDASLGLPIWRYCSQDNYVKSQVSIELNGGFATDKSHLSLHPNAFFGLGWQMSGKGAFGSSTNGMAYIISRAGYSLLDQPSLTGGTNTVLLNNLGEPRYDLKWAPSIGVVFVYPITSALALQAGANAYFTQQEPASWNATLGVTLDLGKFFGALTGK